LTGILRNGDDRPLQQLDGRSKNNEHGVPSTIEKTMDVPRTHGTGLTRIARRIIVDSHFSASMLDEEY
jgi:hypothetical protein